MKKIIRYIICMCMVFQTVVITPGAEELAVPSNTRTLQQGNSNTLMDLKTDITGDIGSGVTYLNSTEVINSTADTKYKNLSPQLAIDGDISTYYSYSVYSGCNGCPNCYKNKGISNMVERLKIYNPTITYVDGYIEPHKKARFKCMKCGHVWEVTAYEAYTGSSHCPNCSKYSALFTECDIVKKLKENNPSITYIGGYTGSTDM